MSALHHAASDNKFVSLFKEFSEFVCILNGNGSLRVEENECIACAVGRAVLARLIQALRTLLVNRYSLLGQIFNRSVLRAAVDAEDLIEFRAIDQRNIVFTAFYFIPGY